MWVDHGWVDHGDTGVCIHLAALEHGGSCDDEGCVQDGEADFVVIHPLH